MDPRQATLTLAAVVVAGCGGDGNPTGTPDPDPTPTIEWAAGAQIVVDRLDVQRFKDNIRVLAAFGDRTQGSQSNLAAGAWIQEELEGYGYVVERHPYTFEGEARESIYATKLGATNPAGMYIVSAHFDGRGGGGAADDDASGVSLVMETARVMAATDVVTDASVRFILWNNEETGLVGSSSYVSDRQGLQGVEDPPGSNLYPEPTWLGVIQHDMILFDHGLPVQATQAANADVDVEYQRSSRLATESLELARLLRSGSSEFSTDYPAEVGTNMRSTDSWPFRNHTAAVSVRENRRVDEIGRGANPHWHQPTDLFSTYSDADFRLGFNALQMTTGTVAHLAGVRIEG